MKHFGAEGIASLWRAMERYVNSKIPKKISSLENDAHYLKNAVTTFNGQRGDVIYSSPVNSVNGKQGDIIIDVPKKVSELQNDAGYTTNGYEKPSTGIPAEDLSSSVQTSLGKADSALQSYTETDPTVPSWAKASTKPSYSISEISGGVTVVANPTLGSNPQSLTSITIGDTSYAIESEGGSGDENIIETIKVNNTALEVTNKTVNIDLSGYAESSDLARVASTGSYDDLIDTPEIPRPQVQTDWDATTGMGVILNKPTLATVATSGSYNDLSNTPPIPTITGKADKVSSATNGNFAGLDSEGNLTDSGHKHSDYQLAITSSNKLAASNVSGLSTVATSGSYTDLSNKPTIPTIIFRTYTTT